MSASRPPDAGTMERSRLWMGAMKHAAGRNVFVVDLERTLGADSPEAFAARCREAHLAAVWIRIGRGARPDPNLTAPRLAATRTALESVGVELWGWHVPFCADPAAAETEAALLLQWAEGAGVAGVVVDAERTPESPRFRGGAAEAARYCARLVNGLDERGLGVAFSSHDQPSLHRDLPFATFLDWIPDVCPQVYYRGADPTARLARSIRDYGELIPAAEFTARYRPTGNISIRGDVAHPDLRSCLDAATAFTDFVREAGFRSHSFWCLDTAPDEVWSLFENAGP
jgi:hypothetical protein